jgi:S1-C subfamily serine protease
MTADNPSEGRIMLRLVTCLVAALLAAAPALAQQKSASAIRLSLPNTTWHLEIPAMGFAVQRDTMRPDGHGRSLYAVDKARGLNLSVFLERVPRSASARECRELYWQRLRNSPVNREEVRMSERGDLAILEYAVKEFGPLLPLPDDVKKLLGKFEQRHLNAYLARGGICVDIHLSKVVKPGDEAPPFGGILEGVRLVDADRTGPQQARERVRASVVVVHAQKELPEGVPASGSGFFVTQDGHVVVAGHVVTGASTIEIALEDGSRLVAQLLGRDARTNLALLKVKAQAGRKYAPLRFATKEARMGDRVFVVSGGGEVTEGTFALEGSDVVTVAVQGGRRVDGPVVNIDGEVVAIVMAYLRPKDGRPSNLGFALPGKVATRVAEELRTKGEVERGWFGLTLANFRTDVWAEFELPRPRGSGQAPVAGALIERLDEIGPAYTAGLRAGDRIVKLNEAPVRTAGEFLRKIGDVSPGTTVSLTIVREGAEKVLAVKRGASPNESRQ